jgi:hypothetical protein
VRLDHLLSKEHLPPKGGQDPAPPVCVVVGGSYGGDTDKLVAGNGRPSQVQPAMLGRGTMVVVRLAEALQADACTTHPVGS